MASSVVVDTTPSYAQDSCYTAENDRRLMASLVCEEGVSFGACPTGDLEVQDSPTGGLTVQVLAGSAWVEGETISCQGMYHVISPTTQDLSLDAADPVDPRVDLIVLVVEDAQYEVTTEARLDVVTGTPGAGAPAPPANSIVLAEVAVAAGQVEIVPGNISDQRTAYELCARSAEVDPEIVTFTANGTFEKANYPLARGFRVRLVGGGGGGGGTQTAAGGQASRGGGGGGGGYAEAVFLPSALAASEAVTVGAGGGGGSSGPNAGSSGGTSIFSTLSATGGSGGAGGVATGGTINPAGGGGGTGVGGSVNVEGDDGFRGVVLGGQPLYNNRGGGNPLGGQQNAVGDNANGLTGRLYGGGGTGAGSLAAAGRPGGDGAPGIVIIEVL